MGIGTDSACKWTSSRHVACHEAMTLGVLSVTSSSSSFLVKASVSNSIYQQQYRNCLFAKKVSKPAMEKHSQDEEARERCSKESCEFNAKPKRPSDDIIPHILNLYGSCSTPRDYKIYALDATFEDPLMCAHGVKQIKSAFYSLSKIFSESRIVEYSIEENVISPGKREILIDNKQYYKFLGKGIDVISLIKLYVEEGKVVRHEDWWDKKPLLNRETVKLPLVGRILEMTRRGSMLATHAMMRFGKDPTVKDSST